MSITLSGSGGREVADTDANLDAINTNTAATATRVGATSETAAATDTANSGLNGLLKRLLQRFGSLTGETTETAPATDIASSGLNGRLQRISQRLTTVDVDLNTGFATNHTDLVAIEGKQDTGNTSLASLETRTGATNETAAATDTSTSGLNGLLKRIAQRLTSLITGQSDGTQRTKITDGTSNVNVNDVAGTKALTVEVVRTVSAIGSGVSQSDQTAFVPTSTSFTPTGGTFNDSIVDVTSGNAGVVRMTAKRALHTHLRDSSGTELATASAPLRVLSAGFSTASNTRVSVGNAASVQLLAANTSRRYAYVMNQTGSTLYIKMGAAAVASQGITLPSNSMFEITLDNLWTGTINAISAVAVGTVNVDVFEGTP